MRQRRFARAAYPAALAMATLASVYAGRAVYPAAGPGCDESGHHWKEPAVLPGRGVARPELALGGENAYAFGSAAPGSGGPGAEAGPPSIFALPGGALGSPPGAVGFFDPVMAADRAGTLHVVWAEGPEGVAPAPSAPFAHLSLTRILYARYQAGRWSQASVIYRAEKIPWQRPVMSQLAIDGGGQLHLAFAAQRVPGPPALVHLRTGGGGWRATEWNQPLPPGNARSASGPLIPATGGIYPSVAAGPGSRLYLAFLSPARFAGGAPVPGGDANSLWVKRSDDGGAIWSPPVLVHQSGPRGAYEPRILAAGADTVHIIWQKDLDGAPGPDAVWHAISTDGGGRWSEPDELRAPGRSPFRNLRATVAPGGEPYIAFASAPPGDPRGEMVFYSRRAGSAWSVPRPLRPGLSVNGFDLTADGAGRLHLLWSHVAPVQPGRRESAGRTLSYSVGSPCGP